MNYDVLNNRYKLIEKIGMGGMAIVYKGIDLRLSRTIAIKVLKDELLEKSEFIKRFEIEAQSVASLSHPNIVPVYDIGDFNDIHFIIMEYINGKSLKELILKEKVLSIDSIINLFIQLCRAIDHAHENDIIHRDIKPHNILISKNSKIKVTDFGIAKIISQSTLTQDGSFMGSAYYFSPEQAKGEKADFRSDIYSLGITLYEMLTGSLPFQGDHLIAVVMQQVQKEPDFNHKRFKMLPAGFENILKKMLEKDPTNRYQNIKDLMIDLYSVIKLDTNSLYEKYKFKETIKSSKNTINQPTTVKKHNSQYKIKSSINNTHNKTDNPNEVKSSTDKNIISNKGKNDFYKVIKSVMPQVTSNSFPQNTNYINYKDLETYEIIKLYDDKLFSGLSNGQVKIWNLNTKKCLHSILAAQNPIKYLTIFKNILATTSANNNTIQIWDIKTGKLLYNLKGHNEAIKTMSINKEILVSGSKEGVIKVWNLKTGTCRGSLNAHNSYIKCLQIYKKIIISGSSDGTIKFWNSGDGSLEKEFKSTNDRIVNYLDSIDRLVYNNTHLISATKTGLIKLWDTSSKTCIREFKTNSSIENMSIFNNHLITVSYDASIMIWDIFKGECIKTYKDKFYVNSVSIKNSLVANVSKEGTIKIRDLNNPTQITILNKKK